MTNTRVAERFWPKVQKTDSCWIWTGSLDGYGYGMFRVDPTRVRRAHRVAYELEHGEMPDGTVYLHSCDNPPCVNPSHLTPGTRAENNADRDAKGRHVALKGEANPRSKLTQAAVVAIRNSSREWGSAKRLALEFGVSVSTIHQLRCKSSVTWRGVA